MTKAEIRQQENFTEWLKVQGLYDPMASGRTMYIMFKVWQRMKEEKLPLTKVECRNKKCSFCNSDDGECTRNAIIIAKCMEDKIPAYCPPGPKGG